MSFNVEQEIVSPLFNLTVNVTQETLRSLVVETCFRSVLYDSTPMYYTASFHSYKNDNFQMKNCDYIFLILLKT